MSIVDGTTRPTFMLGAGFNADAQSYVADSVALPSAIRCGYPLAVGLARVCFELDQPPIDRSIEDLFEQARRAGDSKPMQRLADCLMAADYHIAAGLIPEFGAAANPYSTFFDRFAGCQFLTFNYDSLPELLLLHGGRWHPRDGYGVPVAAEVLPGQETLCERPSTSLVLHLHGSLCLYTSTFTFERSPDSRVDWYTPRPEPRYLFEPHSVGSLFTPFSAPAPVFGFPSPERRVVAPVPNKAEGLKSAFIRALYERAEELIASSSALISVGYSFNFYDTFSFGPLLAAAESRAIPVILVSPDARDVKARLSSEYRGISFHPMPVTFSSWAEGGFPGAW